MNRLEKAKEVALKLIGPFQIMKEIDAIKSAKSMTFMRKMIASPMVNFGIKNMTKEEISHTIDTFRAKKKKKRDPRTIIEGKSNLFLVEDEEKSEIYARRISEAIVDIMDKSVVAFAQSSRIRTRDESTLRSSSASWVNIDGGKKVVLGRGAIGWVEKQVSTEIIVEVGSTLKVPNFFDHKNVKIQGGRVEIIK